MNIEHLRRALKSEWLTYYRQNRHWIIRLGVWVNCQGQRRPSASFILGALSTLESQLPQLLPLVVDLNSNPDRVVMALGLNFNPEEELKALEEIELHQIPTQPPAATPAEAPPKMLPSSETQPLDGLRTPQRVSLDTAQLSTHELPDREVASRHRKRDRRKIKGGD